MIWNAFIVLTGPGRSQGTPLTAWIRVPLQWVASTTAAQFPDETHTSIRRTFTPPEQPHCKRTFCGYCGTHLSYWSEDPPSEADFLNVTLGSLLGEDLRALQDLDLLPDDVEPNEIRTISRIFSSSGDVHEAVETRQQEEPVVNRSRRQGQLGNLDWFEEMIDGSRLGRTRKTRRGMGTTPDGSTKIQWEVSEYIDDGTDSSTPSGSKRKIGDVAGDNMPREG